MRTQDQLLHSRTRVKARYALIPIEGVPTSRLPEWEGPGIAPTEVRVLASPAMGAGFVQYQLTLQKGSIGEHTADGAVEFFFYVLTGSVKLAIDGGKEKTLTDGGYALIPPTTGFKITAGRPATLLMLRKTYERAAGIELFAPLIGNEKHVKGTVFMGDPGAQLQLLIPDDLQYDMAMNIFTFDVGHSLPYTETHVMEHGLYMTQGKGVYYLDDTWMEVEKNDFIWMGPFCPQSYYATGPVASKYIYYKNVNREISL